MKHLNPELEKQVEVLAELCCRTLDRSLVDSSAEARPVIEALVRGGYARLSDANLQTRLEAAVLKRCPQLAIHRRGELAGVTREMQRTFLELVTWTTQTPHEPDRTQPANISSATDA